MSHLKGYHCQLQGNQPIVLNDPNTVWVIRSGSVGLFAVTLFAGQIIGKRRYLFTSNAGDALFGIARTDCPDQRILAVPLESTELLKLEQSCLHALIAEADIQIIRWVENWLEHFNNNLPGYSPSTAQDKTNTQNHFSLTDGQTFHPDAGTIAWLKIKEGKLRWLGLSELLLTSKTNLFPLSEKMWLEAEGDTQFAISSASSIRDSHAVLFGLSNLHCYILDSIKYLEQQEVQQSHQLLQFQEKLKHQITAKALGNLTEAFGGKHETLLPFVGDSLLIVVGAVGKSLGITIRPPAQTENMQKIREPLQSIARASRLKIRRVLLRDNWWQHDCGSLVAFTEADNQPVALLPISPNGYEIFHPNDHTRSSLDLHTAETLAPIAYTFYCPLPDKVLSFIEVIYFSLKGRSRDFSIVLLTGIAAALLGMLIPQATAILIDNAIPDSDKGLLLQIGIGLLAAALGTALFRLSQNLALLRLETIAESSAQTAVWDRLLSLPISFARRYTAGDLLSRVLSVITIRGQISGPIIINSMSGLFAMLYLGLLFFYNWKLSIIPLMVVLLAVVITFYAGRRLLQNYHPLFDLQGNITGQTVQLINGVAKLRTAGAESRVFAAWSQNYSQRIKLEIRAQRINDGVILFYTVMPTIASGIVFGCAIWMMNVDPSTSLSLSVGTFLAFYTAFRTFLQGTSELGNSVSGALRIVPQARRLLPILQTQPESELHKADPGQLVGRISVENVTFRYRHDGSMTLEHVSLIAKPGEFIALVGASGSGKSTLMRLLLGFEIPESGTIYYDGQDLAGLDIDAVRKQVGVVLQNGRLMSASIFDNIAGGGSINHDEAWEAARSAGLADDIATMPMEMHTVISEGGSNISGGQRQRLLIARALALKPRILLFDEATSALDNRTQAIVSDSLDNLHVTRIVIAHRLSTIRNADRIYVLESGRIVQQGNFEELAAKPGLFSHLMARQTA
jgi:NHLM bacteriocin system ABC transporter ATP-binding protein